MYFVPTGISTYLLEERCGSGRAHAWVTNVHCTQYIYHMEEVAGTFLYVQRENDHVVGREQSVLMKEICLIWSRGRYFSPSLPTQGRGPTGIWNLAHSISDPRAEISGILVMVRHSSAMSRGTTYWFLYFSLSCVWAFRWRMRTFTSLKCLP